MKKIVCFIAALLMAGLCGCKDQQQQELTEKAPDGSYAIEYAEEHDIEYIETEGDDYNEDDE